MTREEIISPPAVAPAGGECTLKKTFAEAAYAGCRTVGKDKGSNGKTLCLKRPWSKRLTDSIKLLSDNWGFKA
jgi:hypothetical protein